MRTDHGGGTDAKNTGWGRDRAKTTQICLKHKVLKKLFIEISKAIKIFIFLSEILKKERHSPLLEELTNAPPPVRGFLTNANHGNGKMSNAQQMPGEWMGALGID